MKARLVRLIQLLAGFAAIACVGYFVRKLLIAGLDYHSFWHYSVRVVAVMVAVFTTIVITQLVSAPNPAESLGETPAPESPFKVSNLCKRLLDVLLSVMLLTVLFPLLVFVSLLIFVLEGYPIFYISKRYISMDRCVSVLKFRTMVRDATSPKHRLKERYMRDGYLDVPLDCEVYTPIGRFLERTQIVEVLQLFNILLNGMSLIGNRPLPKENINLLKQFNGWEGRFASPTGLTGLSQVVGRHNQSPQERLELECMYSNLYRKRSANILKCDLYIVYYTVRLLLLGKVLPIEDAKRIIRASAGG